MLTSIGKAQFHFEELNISTCCLLHQILQTNSWNLLGCCKQQEHFSLRALLQLEAQFFYTDTASLFCTCITVTYCTFSVACKSVVTFLYYRYWVCSAFCTLQWPTQTLQGTWAEKTKWAPICAHHSCTMSACSCFLVRYSPAVHTALLL